MTMLAVKNFFLPERKEPTRFSRMPESFLRSIRRRSLRVKRTKSLVVPEREKRKSGMVFFFPSLHALLYIRFFLFNQKFNVSHTAVSKFYNEIHS